MENKIAIISVYYSFDHWGFLIKNGIAPLMQLFALGDENSDINMLVDINNDKGYSCKLTVYGLSYDFDETINQIVSSLNNFIHKHPSPSPPHLHDFRPGQELWKFFPNNSVDIYFMEGSSLFQDVHILSFRQSLTNLLMEWFETETDNNAFCSIEEILSHALSLQIILLKVIITADIPINLHQVLLSIGEESYLKNNANIFNSLNDVSQKAYLDNAEIIIQYYEEVEINTSNINLQNYHTSILSAISNGSKFIRESIVQKLMLALYDHLCIMHSQRFYVHKMIKKIYEEHLKILTV